MANSIIFHDFPISANFPANELDCTTELNYDWILFDDGIHTGPKGNESYSWTAFSLSALFTGSQPTLLLAWHYNFLSPYTGHFETQTVTHKD